MNVETSQYHVLIVDDELVIRLSLASKLKKAGYHVSSAENGRQAVDIVINSCPDIVVMDLNMPIISGTDTIRVIRQTHPDVPIIALTGTVREAVKLNARSAGAEIVLSKPCSFESLQSEIEQILS